jgi:hypothetical protein
VVPDVKNIHCGVTHAPATGAADGDPVGLPGGSVRDAVL